MHDVLCFSLKYGSIHCVIYSEIEKENVLSNEFWGFIGNISNVLLESRHMC